MKVDIADNGRQYTLLDDHVFVDEGIMVPRGFVTDFATVPKWLWWVFPPTGYYQRAAMLHDWIYAHPLGMTRHHADAILLRQMARDGVGVMTRFPIWLAVRCWGWIYWKPVDTSRRH